MGKRPLFWQARKTRMPFLAVALPQAHVMAMTPDMLKPLAFPPSALVAPGGRGYPRAWGVSGALKMLDKCILLVMSAGGIWGKGHSSARICKRQPVDKGGLDAKSR